MQNFRFLIILLPGILILALLNSFAVNKSMKDVPGADKTGDLMIGWSTVDITPDRPVLVAGQFPARVSEGTLDPITVTAMAIESGSGLSSDKVIMISCDLVSISDGTRDGNTDNLRDRSRELIVKSIPELRPDQIIINATHTHTAPYVSADTDSKSIYGIELDVLSPAECQKYISERISQAASEAWKSRKPGGISYGLGFAVVGHNRLIVDFSGKSVMYAKTNNPDFSHVEGYEDHSVNLLYTWDKNDNLTGVVINIAASSQITESLYKISADYWHETRLEVRKRLGDDVFILPQCSAAGDQSPHVMIGEQAETRMQKLMFPDSTLDKGGRTVAQRKQIAVRIADAVTSVFPYMKDNIDWDPVFSHKMEKVELSRRLIGIEDVNTAFKEGEQFRIQYEKLLKEINDNPSVKEKPRWYSGVTSAFTRMKRGYSVRERYELEKKQKKMPVEVHVTRIGDVVFATNPFELYLDYGMRIKARSQAIQTFLVQLTGSGSYLPPTRSTLGGSYGAVPASTLMGPEGGQELVEKTLEMINTAMQK
jgi:hypothetical protein